MFEESFFLRVFFSLSDRSTNINTGSFFFHIMVSVASDYGAKKARTMPRLRVLGDILKILQKK